MPYRVSKLVDAVGVFKGARRYTFDASVPYFKDLRTKDLGCNWELYLIQFSYQSYLSDY